MMKGCSECKRPRCGRGREEGTRGKDLQGEEEEDEEEEGVIEEEATDEGDGDGRFKNVVLENSDGLSIYNEMTSLGSLLASLPCFFFNFSNVGGSHIGERVEGTIATSLQGPGAFRYSIVGQQLAYCRCHTCKSEGGGGTERLLERNSPSRPFRCYHPRQETRLPRPPDP